MAVVLQQWQLTDPASWCCHSCRCWAALLALPPSTCCQKPTLS